MEFQAIVLAGGRGSRMDELASTVPKCLLPIGCKPMIYYPVRMLEQAGFKEINIITLESIKNRVKEELVITCGISASLNMIGIDDMLEDDDMGTAKALHTLKDKIVHDCMIVSCDLISNICIQQLANYYRFTKASCVMLLSDTAEQNVELTIPGSKGKYAPERDLIGFDPSTNRLLYFNAQADIEDNRQIKLKKSVLKRYPTITWTTKLHDAHFYIIKKWLFDYIVDNPNIFSLKGDFIPLITRKQFSTNHHHKHHDHSDLESKEKSEKEAHKKPGRPKIFDYAQSEELAGLINKSSSSKAQLDLISCYIFIQFDGICLRANNLPVYAEANRIFMSKLSHYFKSKRTESVSKYEKNRIGTDSFIGDATTLGEKALVKRSILGRSCQIGAGVKITNSVLMDNVRVEDGVSIQGSIICSNSIISSNTELKDCLVGFSQDNLSGKHSNETIIDVDNIMEI